MLFGRCEGHARVNILVDGVDIETVFGKSVSWCDDEIITLSKAKTLFTFPTCYWFRHTCNTVRKFWAILQKK